jgi:hypothetical protein
MPIIKFEIFVKNVKSQICSVSQILHISLVCPIVQWRPLDSANALAVATSCDPPARAAIRQRELRSVSANYTLTTVANLFITTVNQFLTVT